MNDDSISGLADLFVALSDKTRLRLLGLIGGEQVSVGYLADSLGESQPKVSRHLAYLRGAGLVSTRRDGKWIYYGVEMPEDTAQRNVLIETLRMLGVGFGAPASQYSAAEQPRYDVSDDFASTPFVPNEIEVWLL